jgi:chemotaxis response regulator CheB
MEELRTVVLYGNSLYVAGLEACLKGKPGLDVVRVDATLPDPGQRLKDLCPDVIILDLAAPDSEFAIPFLRKHPGLPIIDLDITSDTVVVLSTQQYTTLSANDLAQVIWTPIRPQN